jgi:hypothetical protein
MTALGALPTNQPLPVGSVQRIMGAAEATPVIPNGNAFSNGAGPMAITVTPSRPCVWVVQANFIHNHNVAGWYRFDAGIYLNQNDLRGVAVGHRGATSNFSVYGWQSFASSAMFYLAANISYTAYLWGWIGDGQTVYHQAARHLNLFGYTLGENYH